MSRGRKPKSKKSSEELSYAAGADIGAREIYVGVAVELTETPVRRFSTFTEEFANWWRGWWS